MRSIDTDRRSFIPLRIAYIFISALTLVATAVFLLPLGAWGVLAFCCLNAPSVVISLYFKDGKPKRFNENLASLADIFRALG